VSAVSLGRPVDREPRLAARAISDTNARMLPESPRLGPKTQRLVGRWPCLVGPGWWQRNSGAKLVEACGRIFRTRVRFPPSPPIHRPALLPACVFVPGWI